MATASLYDVCLSMMRALVLQIVARLRQTAVVEDIDFTHRAVELICALAAQHFSKDAEVHRLDQYRRAGEDTFCAKLYCPKTRTAYSVCGRVGELECPGCNTRLVVREETVVWVEESQSHPPQSD